MNNRSDDKPEVDARPVDLGPLYKSGAVAMSTALLMIFLGLGLWPVAAAALAIVASASFVRGASEGPT